MTPHPLCSFRPLHLTSDLYVILAWLIELRELVFERMARDISSDFEAAEMRNLVVFSALAGVA